MVYTSRAPQRASLAYVALGSNLGDRTGLLLAARAAIDSTLSCEVKISSSLYETGAWGSVEPQPDYLNAVIAVETSLTPHHLWTMLASIELAQGRVRGTRPNAARTLDIDVLLIDDIVMNSSDLTLPHPRMHLRKFVLVPLLEIAPDICIPGWGAASKLLAHTVDSEPRKLGHNRAWN